MAERLFAVPEGRNVPAARAGHGGVADRWWFVAAPPQPLGAGSAVGRQ